MHTSWETRDALAQLGGFKRVLNYMKRVDEAEVGPSGHPCRHASSVSAPPPLREPGRRARAASTARAIPTPATYGRTRHCSACALTMVRRRVHRAGYIW
jgi:hypothetical protein